MTSPDFESRDRVVLTVGRASPVAFAISPAVDPASLDSAASTVALVSPGAVRDDARGSFVVVAARFRVRAEVRFGPSDVSSACFAAGC